jgi:hypothetical protein
MARPRQSAHLKRAFLKVFGEQGIISRAADQVGIDRNTVYYWQEHDAGFAAAFRQAEARATELLEAEAHRRAVQGVERLKFDRGLPLVNPDTGEPYREREYSDTLLIFLLKARNPAKYRDNSRVELTGKDGGPIDIDVEPADRIARRIAELAARVGASGIPGEPQ